MRPAGSQGSWIRQIFCELKFLSYGMSSRLIYNIRQLVGTRTESHLLRGGELADLPSTRNAWLHIEDDQIAAYGPMSELPEVFSRQLAGHRMDTGMQPQPTGHRDD